MSETPDELIEDLPEFNEEPDNDPVDGPEPEVEDRDQDPEGLEIPEQNKHEDD